MLVELSMVEQRYDAVERCSTVPASRPRDSLRGRQKDPSPLAGPLRHRRSRALADKSPGPIAAPTRWHPRSKRASSNCAGPIPRLGSRTIFNKFRRELEAPPSSRAAIYRCLVRHRLIQPKPQRRRRDDYKRWERSRSMELWQLDILGGLLG